MGRRRDDRPPAARRFGSLRDDAQDHQPGREDRLSAVTSITPAADDAQTTGTIVFSHANGFPAGTYRLLFERWRAAGWQVHAVDKFGHDPRHPVQDNWQQLRDELIGFVERQGGAADAPADRPFLVGHSLGGYLSVLAASKRPALARGVVLLDSPIVAGWQARGWWLAKATGLGPRVSPGAVSRRRRQHWPSADAAHAHFAAKPAFARWHPDVLRDYIASGTLPVETGRTLAFGREVETAIYDTLPHHLAPLLRRHPLGCPLAFIGGTRSKEARVVGLRATQRIAQGRVSWIDGTHLYPFERPGETADEVLRWLARLASAGPGAGRRCL